MNGESYDWRITDNWSSFLAEILMRTDCRRVCCGGSNHSQVLVVNVCHRAALLTRSLVFASPRSRDCVRLFFVLAVTFAHVLFVYHSW